MRWVLSFFCFLWFWIVLSLKNIKTLIFFYLEKLEGSFFWGMDTNTHWLLPSYHIKVTGLDSPVNTWLENLCLVFFDAVMPYELRSAIPAHEKFWVWSLDRVLELNFNCRLVSATRSVWNRRKWKRNNKPTWSVALFLTRSCLMNRGQQFRLMKNFEFGQFRLMKNCEFGPWTGVLELNCRLASATRSVWSRRK